MALADAQSNSLVEAVAVCSKTELNVPKNTDGLKIFSLTPVYSFIWLLLSPGCGISNQGHAFSTLLATPKEWEPFPNRAVTCVFMHNHH